MLYKRAVKCVYDFLMHHPPKHCGGWTAWAAQEVRIIILNTKYFFLFPCFQCLPWLKWLNHINGWYTKSFSPYCPYPFQGMIGSIRIRIHKVGNLVLTDWKPFGLGKKSNVFTISASVSNDFCLVICLFIRVSARSPKRSVLEGGCPQSRDEHCRYNICPDYQHISMYPYPVGVIFQPAQDFLSWVI
jgi:hypothetical protein